MSGRALAPGESRAQPAARPSCAREAPEAGALPLAGESRAGWLTSLAFWTCLVFSGALYAAAALAPKVLSCLELTQEHHANQLKLVALEQDDQRVQRIIKALQDDPRYAQELARQDFAVGGSDERIPVGLDLSLEGRPGAPELHTPEPDLPWYTPLVALVARDDRLTTSLLVMASAVVVFAFGFLHSRP